MSGWDYETAYDVVYDGDGWRTYSERGADVDMSSGNAGERAGAPGSAGGKKKRRADKPKSKKGKRVGRGGAKGKGKGKGKGRKAGKGRAGGGGKRKGSTNRHGHGDELEFETGYDVVYHPGSEYNESEEAMGVTGRAYSLNERLASDSYDPEYKPQIYQTDGVEYGAAPPTGKGKGKGKAKAKAKGKGRKKRKGGKKQKKKGRKKKQGGKRQRKKGGKKKDTTTSDCSHRDYADQLGLSSGSDGERAAVPGSDSSSSGAIKYFEGSYGVLVTDMSGFTRITRKMGVTHFASLIMMMRRLLRPMLEFYGAVSIETEADNFFALFPDPESAVSAAMTVYPLLDVYNDQYAENDDYKIGMGGVGVGFGEDIIQDRRTGKLYGPPVDNAFRLGEDVAEKREVLIDAAMYRKVKSKKQFRGVSFDKRRDDEDPSGEPMTYYNCTGDLKKYRFPLEADVDAPDAPPKDASDAEMFMANIERRLLLKNKRKRIDKLMQRRFNEEATVLMHGVNFALVTERGGVEAAINVRNIVHRLSKPIVARYNGSMEEDALWIFTTPLDAVRTALDVRAAMLKHNAKCKRKRDEIPLVGFGAHMGTLMVVRGTNVHWGDPVNTSSKLGEDMASNGEIFITHQVYEAVKGSRKLRKLYTQPHEMEISKVMLKCMAISWEPLPPTDGPESEYATDYADHGMPYDDDSQGDEYDTDYAGYGPEDDSAFFDYGTDYDVVFDPRSTRRKKRGSKGRKRGGKGKRKKGKHDDLPQLSSGDGAARAGAPGDWSGYDTDRDLAVSASGDDTDGTPARYWVSRNFVVHYKQGLALRSYSCSVDE